MRKLILALSAAALAVPALPAEAIVGAPKQQQQAQTWRGEDGRLYCRRPNGTIGLVVGGAAGAMAGRAFAGQSSRGTGTMLGGALGALLGRQVERTMTTSRCR